VPLQLDRILATPVAGDTVGAPPGADTTVGGVADHGWTLRDLSTPVVTLRASAIAHNLAVMQDWIAAHGVELFPHGKTTMAPQLWDRQLAAGAGGITAATPAQLRAMHAVGVPGLLLANELVDADAIGWVARSSGGAAFACWVDAVDGVTLLADALRSVAGCEEAADIGECRTEPPGMVMVDTAFGGRRVLDMLAGDPLPRIC